MFEGISRYRGVLLSPPGYHDTPCINNPGHRRRVGVWSALSEAAGGAGALVGVGGAGGHPPAQEVT